MLFSNFFFNELVLFPMQDCHLFSYILGPSLLLIVSLTVLRHQYLVLGSVQNGSSYILFEQNGSYHPLKQSWKHYNPKQAKSDEVHQDEYRLKLRKATPCICLFFFFLQPHCTACTILVSQPGIEPAPPVVEAQSSNHQTTREFPISYTLYLVQHCSRTEHNFLIIAYTPRYHAKNMTQLLSSSPLYGCV